MLLMLLAPCRPAWTDTISDCTMGWGRNRS
jgi:hypothetical protein